jgi:hypothetical protein
MDLGGEVTFGVLAEYVNAVGSPAFAVVVVSRKAGG